MKNKFLNLLFLFCCLVLMIGPVYAEDDETRYDFSVFEVDENSGSSENNVDYTSACSKYSNVDERTSCCSQYPSTSMRDECMKSLYNVCMEGKTIAKRSDCCAEKFTGEQYEACKNMAANYCSVNEQVKLAKAASAVKVEYEPVEIKAPGYDDPNSSNYSVMIYALDIKIYNITDDIYAVVSVENGNSYSIDSSMNNSEGYIVLRDDGVGSIKKYKFDIRSQNGNCEADILRSIELSTPKYNQLSNRNACREVPHFYKCQEFVSYDFEADNYLKDIEEYKEKLAKQGIKDTKEGLVANNGAVGKTIKKISDYKWIVLATILLIGCIITIIIIRKRRDD